MSSGQWQVDGRAALRAFHRLHRVGTESWLHQEIARRLGDKLDFLRMKPRRLADWASPGSAGSAELARRYPQSQRLRVLPPMPAAPGAGARRSVLDWLGRLLPSVPARAELPVDPQAIAPGSLDLVWANLVLQAADQPMELLRAWHAALAVDGFLMFSTLGPDTLRELAVLYERSGFGPPAQVFRDMHDVGDMLVDAGFSDPVMDMERLRLTWADPAALLADLRAWGGNLHPARFAGLRTPRWRDRLHAALRRELAGADGRLVLSLEIVYGHAVKPLPRAKVAEHSTIALDDMRTMMRASRVKKPDPDV